MVGGLILVSFLVLDFLNAYGMQVQINGNLNFSYGFGALPVLSNMDVQEGFGFDQQLQFMVNGEIEDGLYISSSIGTQTNYITLYYVPFNIQLGNVTSSVYGVNNFSIFGIKTHYISFGQLSGTLLNTTVTVSPLYPSITLGPMLYGSVLIYFDGQIVNSNLYTVDYTTGTIYFSNLSSTETFSVEYQSASINNGSYLLTSNAGFNKSGYALNGSFCTVFSTPSNQFFGIGEIKKDDLSIQTALNFDNVPSFKTEINDNTKIFGKKTKIGISYTSDGFRYPMGIVQLSGIGGNVDFDSFELSFNKNYIGITSSGSSVESALMLGTQNGLSASVKYKNFQTSISVNSSNVSTFESFSNEIFNLMIGQNLSNSTNWSILQIATPVSVEASLSTYGFGISLSKLIGPSSLDLSFSKTGDCLQGNFGISNFFIMDTPFSGNIQISNASTSALIGNVSFSIPSGTIGLTATSFPSFGLSFSNSSWNLNGQLWNNGWNMAAGFQMNMSNLILSGNLTIEDISNQIGGAISFNVGGTV